MSEMDKYVWRYRVAGWTARFLSPLPLPVVLLLKLYGSDKERAGWHSYGSTYGRLFRKWKYRRVRILEIGVGGYRQSLGGQSLLAWRAYFPFGTVIGCDILPKTALAGGNCRIKRLDQSSASDLDELRREEVPFDIIIDDGSHLNRHQIFTFCELFRDLKDGGVYIIEDVQTSFWPGRVGDVAWDGAPLGTARFSHTCCGWFLDLAAYINHAEFLTHEGLDQQKLKLAKQITHIAFEHNLIIIRKGANEQASAFVHPVVATAS